MDGTAGQFSAIAAARAHEVATVAARLKPSVTRCNTDLATPVASEEAAVDRGAIRLDVAGRKEPGEAPTLAQWPLARHMPSRMTGQRCFIHRLVATDGAARAGVLTTAHGQVETPVFMPVGTAGTVKGMTADAVRATGTTLVLSNTYHLMLRPGAERIARLGGLHRFMDWPGPILTDSGGFQVMSLAKLRRLDTEGVTFQSHLDGSTYRLTPARAVEIQHLLDATITMALDECTSFPATANEAQASMELSMRWAARSKEAFVPRPGYALFGIVQGSVYPALRAASVSALTEIGFDGYAVGGLAIGEGQATTFSVLDVTMPLLPHDRPRYLMGVGTPDDIIGAVMRGVDMFDCVIPTRAGRTGRAYTSSGVSNLRNARFADDAQPLDPLCRCPACTHHPRGYLHHLFNARELLGPMLLTWHNVAYYQDLMRSLRAAILEGRLAQHAANIRAGWTAQEDA